MSNNAPSQTRSFMRTIRCALFVAGAATLLTAGCYERNLASPVEYSESEVETLRNEIENFEWE